MILNSSFPMNESLSFRKADTADDDTIRPLLEQSKLPTDSIGAGTTEFFVAALGNRIVGVAGFEFYGPDALLRSVVTAADLRNKRIGSEFVDWMVSHAASRAMKRIVLLTETAERFFARKGFVATDRNELHNEALSACYEFQHACPSTAVCMVLLLS